MEALRLVAAAAVRAVPAGEAPEILVADRVADPAPAVVEGDPVGETAAVARGGVPTAGADQVVRVVRAVTRETVLVVRAATVMTGRAGPSVMMTGLVVRVVTVMTVRVVPVVMMIVHRAGRSVTVMTGRAGLSVTMTVHPGRSASRVPRLSVASAR